MMDYFYLDDYDPGTISAPDQVSPGPDNGDVNTATDEHTTESLRQSTDTVFGFGVSAKKKNKAKKKGLDFRYADEPEPEPKSPLPDSTGRDANVLELHAKVFAMASKYDIKPLELTARKKLKDELKREWRTDDMIAAMDVVFNRTPEGEIKLRTALKNAIVRCAIDVVQHPGFEEAVADIDGLAYDLFRRMSYVRG